MPIHRSILPACSILCLALSTLPAQADDPPPPSEHLPGPGWRWEMPPRELPSHWLSRGFARHVESGVLSLFATAGGSVVAQHVWDRDPAWSRVERPAFRVVLLDGDGEPRPSRGTMTVTRDGRSIARHSFDGDGPGDLERIGLAVLDFDGRVEAAAAAREEAEEIGASTLPLPIVGEPFPFDLPTMDGGRVRSEDLRGKVVLLDAWASW